MPVKDLACGRRAARLLLLGLLLVAVAQLLLIWRPKALEAAAPAWTMALWPVWPHTGPAIVAIALFVTGSSCYALSSRRLLSEVPVGPVTLSFLERTRRLVLPILIGSVGLALYLSLLPRLSHSPDEPSHGGGFLLSWGLILGALFLGERWSVLRSRPEGPRRTRIREGAYVVVMSGVFFGLSTFDLRNWYYSCLGDEFSFHEASTLVAQGRPWIPNVFYQRGVHGIVPVMSTWFQGSLMRLFGTGLLGWKIAALVPMLASFPLAYLLAKALYGRRVAVLTLGMLASSHYLLAYAHTGYPNLESIPLTLASLLVFVWGVRQGSRMLLVLSGALAGLGWYTFYSSRATIVILALVLVSCVGRSQRWKVGWPIAVGFLLLLLPLLLVNGSDLVAAMLERSLKSDESVKNRAMLPLWNLGRSLLAFNYNTKTGPFLAGSLAEPITAALFVLGLGYAVATWRDVRSRGLLLWFAVALTVTGVLSAHDYVSFQRLHYVLPAVALFAALAVDRTCRVTETLAPAWASARRRIAIVSLAITVITASNLYRWFVQAPRAAPSEPEAVAIRILERPRCQRAVRPPVIVAAGENGAYRPALEARGSLVRPEFAPYAGPRTWLESADSRCVVFPTPTDPEAAWLMRAVEERFPGKRSVEEIDRSGERKIRVYYP